MTDDSLCPQCGAQLVEPVPGIDGKQCVGCDSFFSSAALASRRYGGLQLVRQGIDDSDRTTVQPVRDADGRHRDGDTLADDLESGAFLADGLGGVIATNTAAGGALQPEDLDGTASDSSPTRDEMLAAIPETVRLAVESDVLLQADPAILEGEARRVCVAERRAGGRCTATAPAGSLLCNAHSGRLDPRSGGLARARSRREASDDQAERMRLAALGTRAVILQTLQAKNAEVQRTVSTLLDAAASGDLASAKLVLPYINQALGTPTESVVVVEAEGTPMSEMSDAQLQALVARRRQQQQAS